MKCNRVTESVSLSRRELLRLQFDVLAEAGDGVVARLEVDRHAPVDVERRHLRDGLALPDVPEHLVQPLGRVREGVARRFLRARLEDDRLPSGVFSILSCFSGIFE